MNPDEHADSIIHRLAAGVKVSALFLAGTIVFLLPGPAEIGLITILIMILYRVSGIKIQEIFSILKPLVWLFVIFFTVQLYISDLMTAIAIILRFATLVLLAALVTATTRVSEMLAAIERGLTPLRHLGISPKRAGMTLSLALRFLPLMRTIAEDVRDAQAARGGERNLFALLLPTLVRALRAADEVADALDARGFD